MRRVKTAVLISGRGSNMLALVEAAKSESYPASIDLVISNRPDAAGLKKAASQGIAVMAIDHKRYKSRRQFEAALHQALKAADIELICCAGFMRVLTPWFVEKWPNRLLNIHPSLLPKYKGLNTHQRVLESNDTQHGCTVHWVTAELDGGDIIAQASLGIEDGDTPTLLAEKILPLELTLYPQALEQVAAKIT